MAGFTNRNIKLDKISQLEARAHVCVCLNPDVLTYVKVCAKIVSAQVYFRRGAQNDHQYYFQQQQQYQVVVSQGRNSKGEKISRSQDCTSEQHNSVTNQFSSVVLLASYKQIKLIYVFHITKSHTIEILTFTKYNDFLSNYTHAHPLD